MKRRYKIILLAVTAIVILVLLKLANDNFRSRTISQVVITIDTQGGPELVTETEIRELISQGYDSLTTRQVGEIDLEWVETMTRTNPYVQEAHAYINMDASLTVDIIQSKPVVRVFNTRGESFLMDNSGGMLPVTSSGSAGLLIAAGKILDRYAPSVQFQHFDSLGWEQARVLPGIHKVFLVAAAIDQDTVLKKLITQIYVDEKNQIELIPVIGNQTIILGDVDDLPKKLKNLRYFYLNGYRQIPFGKYRAFDIRFLNQVVCIKKDEI